MDVLDGYECDGQISMFDPDGWCEKKIKENSSQECKNMLNYVTQRKGGAYAGQRENDLP